MKRLAAALWGHRYDLCGVAGAGAVATGIGLIYWPAGVISGGVALIAMGFIGARTEAAMRRRATQ